MPMSVSWQSGSHYSTKEALGQTFDWISRHGIFAEGGMGHGCYEDSVMSLQAAE
jgi:hypothetical protein